MATRLAGPIDEDEFDRVWPKVEAFISAALERDGWKLELGDVIDRICNAEMGLYVVLEEETGEIVAGVCCEVLDFPRVPVFHIALCGGVEMYRWADLIGVLEEEAARLGCEVVRISGRAGWGKLYPDYKEVGRLFERRVVE